MKTKKQKNSKPNVHIEFSFTREQCRVLIDALDFLMFADVISFEEEKISHDSAFEATEKLRMCDCTFTRGEVRASAKAVEVAIRELSVGHRDFPDLEEDFDGIIDDLVSNLPVLEELIPVLSKSVQELKKLK